MRLKKKPELVGTAALPIYEQHGFLFRQSLGSGEFEGQPFQFSLNINGDAFFVESEGRYFSVSTREIVAQVMQQVFFPNGKRRRQRARRIK